MALPNPYRTHPFASAGAQNQMAGTNQYVTNWLAAHPGQSFHGMGFLNALGTIPVVGDVVKGAQEAFGRPGDIVNHPGQFFGKTAAGAAPFLGATIGPWAKVMGAGGHALESEAWKNPLSLVPQAASLAGGIVGGDFGKDLGYAGTAMKVGNAIAGGGRRMAGQPYTNAQPDRSIGAPMPYGGPNTGYGSNPYGAGRDVNPLGFLGGSNTANNIAGFIGLTGAGQPKYPDSGIGDKALGLADKLGTAGGTLLNQGMNGLPALDNMGVLGKVQGVMGQQAENAGVANPFTGQGGSTDPYSLMPHEQEAFNHTADMVNQSRESNLASLRQRLANSGITDPRALAAAEAQINTGHDQMLADTHSNLMNQAFQNRQQQLQQFGQIIPALYGEQNQSQQQALQNARQLMAGQFGGASPIYERGAQQAIDQYRYGQNQAGANLRLMSPTGQPMIPGMSSSGGAGAFPGGGGSYPPGGYGPGYDEQGYPIGGGMPMSEYDMGGSSFNPDYGIPFDPSQYDYSGFDPYSMDTGGYF